MRLPDPRRPAPLQFAIRMLGWRVPDSPTLIDIYLRGLAAGAAAVLALSTLRPGVSRDQRIAIPLACFAMASWLLVDSLTLRATIQGLWPLDIVAGGVAGCFWLMVLVTFEDRRVTPLLLAPALIQMLLDAGQLFLPPAPAEACWGLRNIIAGLLSLHACVVVARGGGGDLIEGRRRLRGLLMGAAAVFAVTNVFLAFTTRFDPTAPWLIFSGGRLYGGAVGALVIVAIAAMFLQMRTAVFGASRRTTGPDPRAEAEERLTLGKLDEIMAAGAWRQESLTIGDLAKQLATPEHRLRRLINQRLGHRNFADFLNSYRIAAAKRRLADPAEARTTVAVIAFDLGYGSLGPFHRAFRAATRSTPAQWRRQALRSKPDLQETV